MSEAYMSISAITLRMEVYFQRSLSNYDAFNEYRQLVVLRNYLAKTNPEDADIKRWYPLVLSMALMEAA